MSRSLPAPLPCRVWGVKRRAAFGTFKTLFAVNRDCQVSGAYQIQLLFRIVDGDDDGIGPTFCT